MQTYLLTTEEILTVLVSDLYLKSMLKDIDEALADLQEQSEEEDAEIDKLGALKDKFNKIGEVSLKNMSILLNQVLDYRKTNGLSIEPSEEELEEMKWREGIGTDQLSEIYEEQQES